MNLINAQSTVTSHNLSQTGSVIANDGHISSSFNDTLTLTDNDVTQNDGLQFSGNSASSYSGFNPYYADKIDANDTFGIGYIGVSASVSMSGGGPSGGASFTPGTSSGTLTYPTLTGNYYSYYHSYNNIVAQAYELNYASRNSTSTYLFGNNTITSNIFNGINL